MPHIRIHPPWHLPESAATPEALYLERRTFLRQIAVATAGAALLPSIGCAGEGRSGPLEGVAKYPTDVARNEAYEVERPLTKDTVATAFNNFYEFTTTKDEVWKLVDDFETRPWSVEIAGLCRRTGTFDLDDLKKKLPQEERVYRFRCVETWAMTVPWIGIPMKALLDWVEPQDSAKFVRFLTAHRPDTFPYRGAEWARRWFPYYEGLRLDEARNELTLLATGMYGRELPKQNGAPVRLVVPWKYGFKSGKSIVKIEFVAKMPATFWNDVAGAEYGFYANVNPEVAHPRWSQAREWRIPNQGERHPTIKFNGYGEQVASLYEGMDLARWY